MTDQTTRLPVRRALISVSDKTGILEFARELVALGVEILSTGGTYKLLKDNGQIPTIPDFSQTYDAQFTEALAQ